MDMSLTAPQPQFPFAGSSGDNNASKQHLWARQDVRLGSMAIANNLIGHSFTGQSTPMLAHAVESSALPVPQTLVQFGHMPVMSGPMLMPVWWPCFGTVDTTACAVDSACNAFVPQQEAIAAALQSNQTTEQEGASLQQVRGWKRGKKGGPPAKQHMDLQRSYEACEIESLAGVDSLLSANSQSPECSSPSDHSSQLSWSAEPRISCWADAVDDIDTDVADDVADPGIDPMCLELQSTDKIRQREAIEWVVSSAVPLALTRRGCRLVQRALEVATPADQDRITQKLHGGVLECVKSPNANHVLQKCIELRPPEAIQFVVGELHGHGSFVARHRFGCRVLQRLVEHCPLEQTEGLIAEVLKDTDKLVRHQYGNFVIQHILQHGSSDQARQIAGVLQADVIRLAKHRIASHVVSCALIHCSPEDVRILAQEVSGEAGKFADLSRRQYGSFVVREVNRVARLHG
jgi:hypothetical protein